MEVAAVSTAARDSDVTVSAVGWYGSWHEKGHGEGKSREKGKGKGKSKGNKGKEKGGEKGKGKSNSEKGKGNWLHEHHDQRWMEPFRGYCGHCWKWGHKKAQCPQWQGRRPMELGAMVSHPSQTVVSDPGSSVSQRVQAVNSSPVGRNLLTMRRTGLMNGGTIRRVTGWKIGKMHWHDSEDCASEWNDNESAYLVCGVAGSNPSLNQQSKDKVKLMIDSCSQSTACGVDLAKGYTERAKLWDIQGQKIEAHGKKIVDVKFHGQADETPVPANIRVDVSDVARNVASMGRLLRTRFDLHFTNHGHTR